MPQSTHHLASSVESGDGVTRGMNHLRFRRNSQTTKSESHPTYHRKTLKGRCVYRECPVVSGWSDTYSTFSVQAKRIKFSLLDSGIKFAYSMDECRNV